MASTWMPCRSSALHMCSTWHMLVLSCNHCKEWLSCPVSHFVGPGPSELVSVIPVVLVAGLVCPMTDSGPGPTWCLTLITQILLSVPPPPQSTTWSPQSHVRLFPMSCSVQCPTKPHCPVQSLPPSSPIPPSPEYPAPFRPSAPLSAHCLPQWGLPSVLTCVVLFPSVPHPTQVYLLPSVPHLSLSLPYSPSPESTIPVRPPHFPCS